MLHSKYVNNNVIDEYGVKTICLVYYNDYKKRFTSEKFPFRVG